MEAFCEILSIFPRELEIPPEIHEVAGFLSTFIWRDFDYGFISKEATYLSSARQNVPLVHTVA